MSVRRAADHHNVMASLRGTVSPKPKPVKEKKAKRAKYVPPRQRVKKELYRVLSEIVRWRDGYKCVQAGTRRGRCYGAMTDGHIIVRADYGTTFDLLNNHCQCAGHNDWHRNHEVDYQDWFIGVFGEAAWAHLREKAIACQGEKSMTTPELEELLKRYQELWDNRPTTYDRQWLIDLGYYGEWMKEHYGSQ